MAYAPNTVTIKMSDEDLEKLYKVVRESAIKQETHLIGALTDFKSAVDFLSDSILDLQKRIDAMEKWVESKREQGL